MKISSTLFGLAIALLLVVPSSKAAPSVCQTSTNLLSNCGFETGSFSGWTLTGNDVPGELNNLYGVEGTDPIDSIAPHSGSYQAYFADLVSNSTTLSQTVSTVAGGDYTVIFYLAQDTTASSEYPNKLTVSFNGTPFYSVTDVPVEGYTEYAVSGVASSASTTVSITLGDSLGEFLLDDVALVRAPEPSAALLGLGGSLFLGGFGIFRRKRHAIV